MEDKTMENNQVATTQPNAVGMPDYLMGYAKEGIGQIKVDVKELKIPLLKMIQLQGECYDAEKNNFGNIYDHISLEDLGNSIDIVVVDYQPQWMKWSADRKLLGLSTDGITWQSGSLVGKTLLETEGDDAFKCKHYNYYVLLIVNGQVRKLPYKISFSGMSAKAGDKIYQILAQKAIAAGYPMFSFVFNIKTTREKGDRGQYSMFHAEQKKEMVTPEVAKIAAEMIRTIKDPNTKVIMDEDKPQMENANVQSEPVNTPPQTTQANTQKAPVW